MIIMITDKSFNDNHVKLQCIIKIVNFCILMHYENYKRFSVKEANIGIAK